MMNWRGEIGGWEAREASGVNLREDRAVRMESSEQGQRVGQEKQGLETEVLWEYRKKGMVPVLGSPAQCLGGQEGTVSRSSGGGDRGSEIGLGSEGWGFSPSPTSHPWPILLSTRGTCSYTSASTAPALERPHLRVWTSGRSMTNSLKKRAVCGSCMIAGPPMPSSWSSSG